MTQPVPLQRPIPFRPYAVHFSYPGSGALRMREHVNDTFIGDEAEWIEGERSEPAAYVKSARPRVRVVFMRAGGQQGPGRRSGDDSKAREYTVSASCSFAADLGIAPRKVTIRFNPSGVSDPVELELVGELPSTVGVWHLNWLWVVHDGDDTLPIGITDHIVYTTWRPLVDARSWLGEAAAAGYVTGDDPGSLEWTYQSLVAWTCTWVHDERDAERDEKSMCDALIRHLPDSGLRYYQGAWHVRDMLNNGGGMCGGWYKMFQAMAAVQGIPLERRAFLVDRTADEKTGAVMWDAIVVRVGGVGLPYPGEIPSTFHDTRFADESLGDLQDSTERRYRFWGKASGLHDDGHCLNFLLYHGKYVLYDASFGDRGVPLELTELPPVDLYHARDAREVGDFKEAYLDEAVVYLLGSMAVDGHKYESYHDSRKSCGEMHHIASINGVSVETRSLTGAGSLPIPFFWGP